MTKRSLADLAAAFKSKAEGGGESAEWKKYFPFWKAEENTVSTVRFLPDADPTNSLGFLVENLTHELNINGKREKVACLKMYGEACPICELSSRFYDEKSPEHSEELGKQFYRKKSYIGQVLVVETPIDHDADMLVKLVEFGPQVFKQIQAAFQSGDLDNAPYELKGGYNFRFRKTKTGSGQNSYTTSNFAPKQSDVSDEIIGAIELYDLAAQRTKKVERSVLEAMLVAAQTGGSYSAAPAAAAAAPAPAPTPAAEPTPAPAPAASTPSEPGKLSMVEQLRLRAAAAKAAQQAAQS